MWTIIRASMWQKADVACQTDLSGSEWEGIQDSFRIHADTCVNSSINLEKRIGEMQLGEDHA